MTKFLNAFLEFKNEADATRKFALFAVVIITLGLASLSVTGIIATATWTFLSVLPTLGLIIAVLGAEALATVAFIRTLTAPTRLRKVAGSLIFLGLAAIGVHNAENGAHVVWPDRFEESSGSLAAKAELAGEEAEKLGKTAEAAAAATPAELERVRKQMADLRVEQKKMAAQSPEGVKEAQALLLAQGKYYGSVDGIRQNLTEAAMRARGEEIQGELAELSERERMLASGLSTPVQSASTDKRLAQIENADKASAAFWAWFWLILMLCTLEGARSLSLWALITDMTGADANMDRKRAEELAAARHQQELAAILAATTPAAVAPTPAPVPTPTPPVPDEPPPVELTEAQRRSRQGGLAAGQAKAAAKAKADNLILVPSLVARDAELRAAKLAAQ